MQRTAPRPSRSARPRAAGGWLLACVCAMLLAQALGFMHRIVHAPLPATAAGFTADRLAPGQQWPAAALRATSADPAADAYGAGRGVQPGHAGHADHWTAGLFSGHGGDSECRLFDALVQPGCAASAPALLPLVLTPALLATHHGDFVARWSALFDARGPPSLR